MPSDPTLCAACLGLVNGSKWPLAFSMDRAVHVDIRCAFLRLVLLCVRPIFVGRADFLFILCRPLVVILKSAARNERSLSQPEAAEMCPLTV